jgi:hypothetical protein
MVSVVGEAIGVSVGIGVRVSVGVEVTTGVGVNVPVGVGVMLALTSSTCAQDGSWPLPELDWLEKIACTGDAFQMENASTAINKTGSKMKKKDGGDFLAFLGRLAGFRGAVTGFATLT